jgi:outer membrane immunogenic protein
VGSAVSYVGDRVWRVTRHSVREVCVVRSLKALALGASACTGLFLGSTFASADGYVRGSIKDAAPCCDSWKGFYIGIHGGYGWKNNDFREFLPGLGVPDGIYVGGIDSKGGLYGGHAGLNWQHDAIVGGLELDLSSTSINGVSAPAFQNLGGGATITNTRADDVKWLGSARARLGFAPGGCCSNLLFYGTGGLAWERFTQTATTVQVFPPTTTTFIQTTPNDRFGWVAGLGAEAKLAGTGWVGRIEYLHYAFGTSQTTFVITSSLPGNSFAESAKDQTIDVIRAGLSYKF